jgi:hypothetical protein
MNRKKFCIIGGILSFILAAIGFLLIATRESAKVDVKGASQRECVPYNIFVMKGSNEYSVDIVWSTRAECVSFILYGRDRGNLDMVGVDLVNQSSSKEHTVTLDQLLTTETYYFLINSQEETYGNNGAPLEFVLENL